MRKYAKSTDFDVKEIQVLRKIIVKERSKIKTSYTKFMEILRKMEMTIMILYFFIIRRISLSSNHLIRLL